MTTAPPADRVDTPPGTDGPRPEADPPSVPELVGSTTAGPTFQSGVTVLAVAGIVTGLAAGAVGAWIVPGGAGEGGLAIALAALAAVVFSIGVPFGAYWGLLARDVTAARRESVVRAFTGGFAGFLALAAMAVASALFIGASAVGAGAVAAVPAELLGGTVALALPVGLLAAGIVLVAPSSV